MTTHYIYFGDSRSMLRIPDRSVQLIVTSPPYWQLKDYGTEDQIGFHDSYEDYINHLNLVWKECDRVLSDGCRLCINIGDQFARSVYYGRYKVIPIRTEIIRFCETLGMDYMGAIIWQKTTTTHTTGGGAIMGSFPYPRNGILKIDYEFILIFKKQGQAPKPTAEQKEASIMTKDEWKTYFSSHWNFPGVKQDQHLAMFPEELPKRLIKMFSYVGETILDPFAGSGTTSLAAKHLGRNSIGYEINRDFEPVMREKLETEQLNVYEDAVVRFEVDECPAEYRFDDLPYLFHDPHRMDKQIDVKTRQFGSRIDRDSMDAETYETVHRVIDPETLELGDGKVIHLLGVKAIDETAPEAVSFLKEKFQGHKIYLRYDPGQSHDMAYVYLENRTFINNHLIRTGYVDVDQDKDYKYKTRFMKTKEDAIHKKEIPHEDKKG